MLRTTITKLTRPSTNVFTKATFTTTARAMAGETGAPPKTGGQG
jgi:hypothetical protein